MSIHRESSFRELRNGSVPEELTLMQPEELRSDAGTVGRTPSSGPGRPSGCCWTLAASGATRAWDAPARCHANPASGGAASAAAAWPSPASVPVESVQLPRLLLASRRLLRYLLVEGGKSSTLGRPEAGCWRPRRASKGLRLLSGVRRQSLSPWSHQAGRRGTVVRQGRRQCRHQLRCHPLPRRLVDIIAEVRPRKLERLPLPLPLLPRDEFFSSLPTAPLHLVARRDG